VACATCCSLPPAGVSVRQYSPEGKSGEDAGPALAPAQAASKRASATNKVERINGDRLGVVLMASSRVYVRETPMDFIA
jgi:hypothetical protein